MTLEEVDVINEVELSALNLGLVGIRMGAMVASDKEYSEANKRFDSAMKALRELMK